jgi:hypothetical protein
MSSPLPPRVREPQVENHYPMGCVAVGLLTSDDVQVLNSIFHNYQIVRHVTRNFFP